ncbi:hypothetical protein [Moraxella sp. ZY210820]|nr:hypothetical protein [Moraxella sp. ZY210820]WLF83475.1 hypothetical protein LU301_09430 [Moraxella sp. ZY210820]
MAIAGFGFDKLAGIWQKAQASSTAWAVGWAGGVGARRGLLHGGGSGV